MLWHLPWRNEQLHPILSPRYIRFLHCFSNHWLSCTLSSLCLPAEYSELKCVILKAIPASHVGHWLAKTDLHSEPFSRYLNHLFFSYFADCFVALNRIMYHDAPHKKNSTSCDRCSSEASGFSAASTSMAMPCGATSLCSSSWPGSPFMLPLLMLPHLQNSLFEDPAAKRHHVSNAKMLLRDTRVAQLKSY